MRNFAKRLTETDRNVSRNFGDSEISVETLVPHNQTQISSLVRKPDSSLPAQNCQSFKSWMLRNQDLNTLLYSSPVRSEQSETAPCCLQNTLQMNQATFQTKPFPTTVRAEWGNTSLPWEFLDLKKSFSKNQRTNNYYTFIAFRLVISTWIVLWGNTYKQKWTITILDW